MCGDSPDSCEQSQFASCVRFSIIITCCNQREFISDAIESVLSQRQPSKEVIVVDDGSQDGSTEVIERYTAFVTLLSLSINCGAIEARNRGAAFAKGDYLIFLDGDDLFTPWALDVYEQLVTERHPTTIVGGARWFSGSVPRLQRDDAPYKVEFVEFESLMARDRQHGWLTGAFVVRRLAFHVVGGWSPGVFHLDLMDLAAKLGYSGNSVLVCSPYTMLYRMHGRNSVDVVPPFLESANRIMNIERAGQYPGGPRKRFERYAFLGGMIAHWTERAWRAGLHRSAVQSAVRGWPMILAAIIRKSMVALIGRRRVEVCSLRFKESSLSLVAAGMREN